jgi:hypothetical protein
LSRNLGLLVPVEVLQDVDRIVGVELAHALGDGLGFELVEDLFADRVVDLGQRREIEVAAHELDEARAVLRVERLESAPTSASCRSA